jgi:hypothetical protein
MVVYAQARFDVETYGQMDLVPLREWREDRPTQNVWWLNMEDVSTPLQKGAVDLRSYIWATNGVISKSLQRQIVGSAKRHIFQIRSFQVPRKVLMLHLLYDSRDRWFYCIPFDYRSTNWIVLLSSASKIPYAMMAGVK